MKTEDLIHRYEKYEHYISPTGLIIGFVWHLMNLKRIDLFFENLLVVFYLVVAVLAIIYLNAHQAGHFRRRFFEIISLFVPFFLQFAIGGLFSSFVTFYGESGAVSVSWPFLLVLVFMLVGNEVFRQRYQRLVFQTSVFFGTIFLYLVFAFPILLNELGDAVFILSGVTSLAAVSLLILVIQRVAPQIVWQSRRWLVAGIAFIYLGLNILYFTNIIPPIPLSLKEGGMAHSVARSGGNWVVRVERAPWYLFYQDFNPVYHWQPGQAVYCYAAVFAPTDIKTNIYHRWMFFDPKTNQWAEKSKIKYPITGGRDGGYRGYSYKTAITPGQWRVDVMTERGQILGRLSFEIVQTDAAPELTTLEY